MGDPGRRPAAHLPAGAWPDSATRVLLAVAAHPFPTYAWLTSAAGVSRQVVHRRLHELRDAGLVHFEDHLAGTLRAAVTVVAADPS